MNDIAYKIINKNPNEVAVIDDCSKNRSIQIPSTVYHKDTVYSVIGIEDAFFYSKAESIYLPNTIRWIHGLSKHLKKVNIPESVTRIGARAFYGVGIDSVFIPRNLTDIGDAAFSGAEKLEFFQVDSLNPAYTAEDGVLYDKSKTTLIAYPAAKKAVLFRIPAGVTHIAECAFESAQIDSLFIPNSVISIGGSAFESSKLSNVVLSENIIAIGSYAFYKCANLYSIIIPSSVRTIENYAFSRCTNLCSIIIPNSVRTIEWSAFSHCTNLTSIVIPDGVLSIESRAFESCANLSSINFPASLLHIQNGRFFGSNSQNAQGGDGAFYNTAWYNSQPEKEIIYIENVLYEYKEKETTTKYKSKRKYDNPAKRRMLQKTEITIPEGIRSISSEAFINCVGLTKITLPESLEYIGNEVFDGCKNLKSIHIPQSVKVICKDSFEESGLRKIQVYWQDPSSVNVIEHFSPSAFENNIENTVEHKVERPRTVWHYVGNGCWKGERKKCKLIVPKGTKKKYQQSEVWKDLAYRSNFMLTSSTIPMYVTFATNQRL